MTEPNEGAFPSDAKPNTFAHYGLTKREYFAASALAGMDIGNSAPDKVAQWAVEYADALIAELNKKP